jgi:hypothetical protein
LFNLPTDALLCQEPHYGAFNDLLGGNIMSMNKSAKLWFVNIFSFVLFSILTLTGLINWLFVPRGGGAGGGFTVLLRHFLRDVHEWTALLFIIMTLIHLALHWSYIKSNLQKSG